MENPVILSSVGRSARATTAPDNAEAIKKTAYFIDLSRTFLRFPYTASIQYSSAFPINRNGRAVYCPRSIRGEEPDHLSDSLRLNPLAVISVGDGAAVLGRINRARHDGVDVDVRGFELCGERFGKSQDRAFGGAVGSVTGRTSQGITTRDVNDLPARLLEHLRNDCAAARERGSEIDSEEEIPIGEIG